MVPWPVVALVSISTALWSRAEEKWAYLSVIMTVEWPKNF
jgi:hypothetical protein